MMNTMQASYLAVINHITADMESLKQNGQKNDQATLKLLQTHHDWLVCRMTILNDQRDQIISGFRIQLEAYLSLCDKFWKERHERTYEKKMDILFETKQRVVKIYSLTGFDACYELTLTIKHLRGILPLKQYDEYAPALAALEAIKNDCYEQLGTYLKA
jgi:hypothetical protein